MLELLLTKEFYTSKANLLIVGLVGFALFVLFYRLRRGNFRGLQFIAPAAVGGSLTGIFTCIGTLVRAINENPQCIEFDEVRWYMGVGAVALIWIAIQSIASKVLAVEPQVATSE